MDNNVDFKALRFAMHDQAVQGSSVLCRCGAVGRGQLLALPGRLRGWRERWLDGLGLPRDGGFAAGIDPLRWVDDAPSSEQRVIPFKTRERRNHDDAPSCA
jgi:hypothetical protein